MGVEVPSAFCFNQYSIAAFIQQLFILALIEAPRTLAFFLICLQFLFMPFGLGFICIIHAFYFPGGGAVFKCRSYAP